MCCRRRFVWGGECDDDGGGGSCWTSKDEILGNDEARASVFMAKVL